MTLSNNNTVITAIAKDYAIAVTALPIPSGEPLQLRVVKPGFIVSALNKHVHKINLTLSGTLCTSFQRFGLTTNVSPNQTVLQKYASSLIHEMNYWIWFNEIVWNVNVTKPVEFDLQRDLQSVNQTVAMMHCSGAIRVFVDGIEVGRPWNNLPMNVPVFGFVGLENLGTMRAGSFKLG